MQRSPSESGVTFVRLETSGIPAQTDSRTHVGKKEGSHEPLSVA